MLAFLPIDEIPYAAIAVLICGMVFFCHAARDDQRSEVVYALASFVAWLVMVTLLRPVWAVAVWSQVMLFIGLTVYDTLRERKRMARED